MNKKRHDRDADVLIAGGGPAGLALAALLGKNDVKTLLIDKKAPPPPLREISPEGRTVAMLGRSLDILEKAGVLALCRPHAERIEAMRIIDDSAHGFKPPFETLFRAREAGREEFGLNIPNAVLHSALYEFLKNNKNVTCLFEEEIEEINLRQGAPDAEIRLAGGAVFSAPLLAAADGRDSAVRQQAGISVRDRDYAQTAMTMLISHSSAHNGISTEFHRPGGPLAVVPLPDNTSSIVWVEKTEDARAFLSLPHKRLETALQERLNGIYGDIRIETPPEGWPVISRTATRLTGARTAILAEAAHVLSPITAQGLNLGLRDADDLAKTVTESLQLGLDPGSKSVLDRYESRRKNDIFIRTRGVDGLNRCVATPSKPARMIRRAAFAGLNRVPAPLRRTVIDRILTLPHGTSGTRSEQTHGTPPYA